MSSAHPVAAPHLRLSRAPALAAAALVLLSSALAWADTPSTTLAGIRAHDFGSVGDRLVSLLGLLGLMGIAFALSTDRRRVNWRLVGIGTALQFVFALIVLRTTLGERVFEGVTAGFNRLLEFTRAGTTLLFGSFADNGQVHPALANVVFSVLPTIVFFSALMAALYHLGVMQRIVRAFAWVMQRTMRTSGAETLSAAANIFVGQTEAPLAIRPFLSRMTRSELMVVMTGGFATIAGGVMASYIAFLQPHFPDIAGHLLAASVMSAPAAIVLAKIMIPETEDTETADGAAIHVERIDANVIDATARGATEGLQLLLNVAAMLLAFVALIAMLNFLVGLPSWIQHGSVLTDLVAAIRAAGHELPADLAARCTGEVPSEARIGCIGALQAAFPAVPAGSTWGVLRIETLFGWVFFPIAFLMGVPLQDCAAVGQLLGTKTVLNEFIAYLQLGQTLATTPDALSPRSVLIASYALCGFANFGSVAIQLGGIGALVPERRADLARIGLRAMVAGALAACMTANIAGVLV